MVITEISKYTMVIQNEEDENYDFVKIKESYGYRVKVFMGYDVGYLFDILLAKEALFSTDVLILYFEDEIPEYFKVGVEVGIKVGLQWFYKRHIENANS